MNAAYKGELEPEVRQLMADFKCTSSDDMSQSPLRDRVSLIKNTEQGVVPMCQAVEKVYNDAMAKGIAEGVANEKKETAIKMLAKGMDIALISELTGLSSDAVEDLKKSA